jgi:DNA-binding MarR family transcriptional regulator
MILPGADGGSSRSEDGTPSALREVEEQMGILAGKIRSSIRDAAASIDPALQPFGLRMMRILERCGPIHAGKAADMLSVDRTAISRQSRQLEELGLVSTRSDPEDRRARFIDLTDEGRSRLQSAGPAGFNSLQQILGRWPDEDLHQFARYLARWVDDWNELGPE